MEKALFELDCGYRIPNVHSEGYLCKTNLPSRTAFRGFGAPQATLIGETWMDQIARTLACDPEQVIISYTRYKEAVCQIWLIG